MSIVQYNNSFLIKLTRTQQDHMTLQKQTKTNLTKAEDNSRPTVCATSGLETTSIE